MATTAQTISPELLRSASTSVIEATERVLRAGQTPGKSAFIARVLNAVATLTDELDERSLADAAGAPSEFRVLMKALDNPDAYAALKEHDPRLPARLRGIQARQQILEAEGGALSAIEVASLLGITRQAVDKRRRAGSLVGLESGRRGYQYPKWQFDAHGGILRGLDRVIQALDEPSPWTWTVFILRANTRLNGDVPLALLQRGEIEPVVRAAEAYGEHGAA